MPILSLCSLRELLEIGTARHRAVVVHDLDDHGGRLEAGEPREIATRLGVTGARQHAAGLRHQRKDVAGLAQVFGARVGRDRRADRVRAIVRRDAGGDAFGGLDRHVKLVRCSRSVSLTISGRRSWRQRSRGQRQADQAAAEARHEVDVFGPHLRAAMMRSPSFSRSSSSMITTMRPAGCRRGFPRWYSEMHDK